MEKVIELQDKEALFAPDREAVVERQRKDEPLTVMMVDTCEAITGNNLAVVSLVLGNRT